jgi:hypothetical protein
MKNNFTTLSLIAILAAPAMSGAQVNMPSVADISRVNAIASYQSVGLFTSNLPTSQVVEIPLANPQVTGVAVVNNQGTTMGSYVGSRPTGSPKSAPQVHVRGFTTATSTTVHDVKWDDKRYSQLPELGDQSQATTLRFAPRLPGRVQRTIFTVDLFDQREVTGISFLIPPASKLPRNVEIYVNEVSGERTLVHAGVSIKDITIPATLGASFSVVIDYDAPVVFSEFSVQVAPPKQAAAYERYVRFLAEPGMTYYVLTATSSGYKPLASPLGSQYSSGSATKVNVSFEGNPWFAGQDTDHDGVTDLKDNCPHIINTDQKDLDANGVGDICEDPDRDNSPNSLDNCPNVYNPDQRDTDTDKVGDVCDSVDNRVGQQEPWLKWVSFAVVALTIGALLYSVRKEEKGTQV